MKLMFVSDVHGSCTNLEIIKDIFFEEKPDEIIFLGDMFSYGYGIDEDIIPILDNFYNKIVIRGNCDSEYDIMTAPFNFLDSYYFEAFNKKIFCSHGNYYNISRYPKVEFDVMIYGHTHRGMIEKENGKYFLNPGSISYPRGNCKSYMILDDSGIYLKDLDKNIIDKSLW